MKRTVVCLSWDWKEQIDLDELAAAIADVSGANIRVYEVDTGSDTIAIVIANHDMTDDQVKAAFHDPDDE